MYQIPTERKTTMIETPANQTPTPAPASGTPEYYPHGKHSLFKTACSLLMAHLGGLLICVIVCFSLSPLMAGAGIWAGAPIVLLAYGSITYNTMWGLGHEDSNLAHFHHITLDPWRGLKVSLIAMAPFLAFGAAFVICAAISLSTGEENWFLLLAVVYRLVNAEVWPLINAVAPQATEGAVSTWSMGGAAAAALFTLIPPVIHQLGYFLGTKDFSIMQRLVYKNKKSKKKPQTPRPPKSQYPPSR